MGEVLGISTRASCWLGASFCLLWLPRTGMRATELRVVNLKRFEDSLTEQYRNTALSLPLEGLRIGRVTA